MAEIVWAQSAIADLDAIADFIALENPDASTFVRHVLAHVAQLAEHPRSSRGVTELGKSRYRQIVEPPAAFSTAKPEASSASCT